MLFRQQTSGSTSTISTCCPAKGLVHQGERIGEDTLDIMACDGVKPYGPMGAPRVRRPDQGPRGSDLRLIASSGRSRCLRRVGCLQRHLASELSDFPFQMTVSYRRGD